MITSPPIRTLDLTAVDPASGDTHNRSFLIDLDARAQASVLELSQTAPPRSRPAVLLDMPLAPQVEATGSPPKQRIQDSPTMIPPSLRHEGHSTP